MNAGSGRPGKLLGPIDCAVARGGVPADGVRARMATARADAGCCHDRHAGTRARRHHGIVDPAAGLLRRPMPVFSRFLRYFMAVGRCGSIRRAADELNVSASAIDRQILQAERQLGVALFERLPSGLRLTAAGEMMMAAAGNWSRELGLVRGQIDDLSGLRRGEVTLAVIDALAEGEIPRLIARVDAQYPGIRLRVQVLDNQRVREAVAAGMVDVGIFLEPQSLRDITVRAHVPVPLGFVTLPGHPLAAAEGRRFAACAGHRMVVPSPPLAVAEQLATLRGAVGIDLDVAAASDNVLMLKSLVRQGLGVGVMTLLDAMVEVERGELGFVAITDPILRPMTLALCTATSRALSAAANVVLADAEAHFARLGSLPARDA